MPAIRKDAGLRVQVVFFFRRHRAAHVDATLGNNVPHLRGELNIRVLEDEVPVETNATPMPADWWRLKNVVIEIDGDAYRMGRASGLGYNCLIDTLRQSLHVSCNVDFIRHQLQRKHPALREGQK